MFATLALAGFALQTAPVQAEPDNVIDEIGAVPASTERIKQIHAATRGAFDAALAEYDQQIEQRPYDIVERLQRCRFFEQFVASYEYSGFIDEVKEQEEQCSAKLVEEHPEHPEVALWQLERTFGEQLLTEGAELLRHPALGTWTPGQLARLYTMLAQAADVSDEPRIALQYALKALDLDERSDVRLIAAASLMSSDKSRALDILTAPVRENHSPDAWRLVKKLDLLGQLDARQQVFALYEQVRVLSDYDHVQVARVLRAVGATDLARQELKLAAEDGGPYGMHERELFRFELESGSADEALTAYEAWRNTGWLEDPLGINRFALFVRDPWLPWQARDVTGLLGFLGALCAIALVCVVPIAGVHYRGLAIRARTGEPYPGDGWSLRHAWAVLTCVSAASLFALYSAGAVDVTIQNVASWGIDGSNEQLARTTFMESLLMIVLLLPFAALPVARQTLWQGAQWSIAKSCMIGIGIALIFRAPLLVAWSARPESMKLLALDDALWQIIAIARDQYGLITALWMVAIVAPVVEEFVFRGVVYRSFAAHISPGWANVVQAALFSALHLNPKAAVLLFVLGLVLGTLARRSGSLLAPMIMHAMFNLVAALILL
jgi:hypothetical protein